jgi:hypothetical protein
MEQLNEIECREMREVLDQYGYGKLVQAMERTLCKTTGRLNLAALQRKMRITDKSLGTKLERVRELLIEKGY